jgi:hypothetical protein
LPYSITTEKGRFTAIIVQLAAVFLTLQAQNQRMAIVPVIQSAVSAQINQLYQVHLEPASITVSETKPEF